MKQGYLLAAILMATLVQMGFGQAAREKIDVSKLVRSASRREGAGLQSQRPVRQP